MDTFLYILEVIGAVGGLLAVFVGLAGYLTTRGNFKIKFIYLGVLIGGMLSFSFSMSALSASGH